MDTAGLAAHGHGPYPPQPALSPGAEVALEQAAAQAWAKATPTVTPAWSAAPDSWPTVIPVSDR